MKLLFVCTGNTCRSPMAEGIFRKLVEQKNKNIECESAGTTTINGLSVSENAVKVCSEIGIDIEGHTSRCVGNLNLNEFDYFIPMAQSHANFLVKLGIDKDKIYMLNNIPDPYGSDEKIYRICRDQIKKEVMLFYKTLTS